MDFKKHYQQSKTPVRDRQRISVTFKNKIMIAPEIFNEFVRNRRSVFPDQMEAGKKIDDNVVKEILTNALWAPYHGHEEPWHFIVFSGEGLQKLAHFQSELYKAEAGESFKESSYQKLQTNPLKASHVIAITMRRSKKKSIPEIEDIEAVACAVENIYLSVSAYGLGGYWTTGGITYYESAKPFFNLGENDKLLGFFYMGYVLSPSGRSRRSPINEKVTWVKE